MVVRVFISSPSDVLPERNVAEQVIARLDREFTYHFHVEAVRWEREPLTADRHFQDIHNIPPPRSTDIVIVVLWSRLGMPLPGTDFRGAISGEPVTGTEWEFEDALAGARGTGRPYLMLYRKTEPAQLSDRDLGEAERKLNQARLVETFMGRWFRDAKGDSFTAASHSFRDTAEFEDKLYVHLRALLERRLAAEDGDATAGIAIRWHDRPFRGLEAFEIQHAPIFFGRTRSRHELRERLGRKADQGCAFILVLGASGSGKSSLIKAGLLPDLMLPGMIGRVALVRRAVLRPADRPDDLFAALAQALLAQTALPELGSLRYTPERLADILRQSPEGAAFPIEQGLDQAGKAAGLTEIAQARLVLLVDQLEELFTLAGLTADVRQRFVAALDALARSGLVWVVATMRSDFFDRIEDISGLAKLADVDARYLLATPDEGEIGQIIRFPAREAGLRFEIDPRREVDLADTIRQAAARDRGALPLLSYLLDQLWQRRTAEGMLTFAAYQELGGLEGALGQRAEEVLSQQPAEIQAVLPPVLRALVTMGQGSAGTATARPIPLTRFPADSPERRLIEAFIAPGARLAVADAPDDGGEPLVRVAHEALLTHWRRASEQIAQDRQDLQLVARLESAAGLWRDAPEAHRASLLLRPGLPLSEAEELLARRRDELDSAVLSFVDTSTASAEREHERERQRIEAEEAGRRERAEERTTAARRLASRTRIAALVLALLALFAVGLAVFGFNQAEVAHDEEQKAKVAAGVAETATVQAKARLSEAQTNESRFLTSASKSALDAGNPELAMLAAAAALPANMRAPDRPIAPEAVTALLDAWRHYRARAILLGHADSVLAAVFSPDGQTVATGSQDATAMLWDSGTAARIAILKGHTDAISALAFSPDSQVLATASPDGTARLWQARTGAALAVLKGHSGAVRTAAFSPDGQRVVTASSDGTARVWDARSGAELAQLKGHADGVWTAVFSPDGESVLTASADKTARIWDARSGAVRVTLKGHGDAVWSATYSADGRQIVTASQDKTARIWRASDGRQSAVLSGHERPVTSASFSPDGQRVVTGSQDNSARLWSAADGSQIAALDGHGDSVTGVAFSPDGQRVVTASKDKTVRLWNGLTGEAEDVFVGHSDAVWSAKVSPDGKLVVSASDDSSARLWGISTHGPVAVLKGSSDALFSPNGKQIATNDGHDIELSDAQNGQTIKSLRGHAGDVRSLAFSLDGRLLVTSSEDATARVWDVGRGSTAAVLKGHGNRLNSAEFSADGTRVVTASDDNTARIWDAQSGKQLIVLTGHQRWVYTAEFSPDGKRVATSSDDHTARIWDAESGATLATLTGHGDSVFQARFSPDARRVLTASRDGTARLWDAGSGRQLAVLGGHVGFVFDARFSSDGQRIVSVAKDKTGRLWNASDAALIAVLRGHTDSVEDGRFSRDGERIATAAEDGMVRIWDGHSGAPLAVLDCHTGNAANAPDFAPDNRRLVAACGKNASVWDVWPLLAADSSTVAMTSLVRRLTPQERDGLSLSPVAGDAAMQETSTAEAVAAISVDELEARATAGDPYAHLRLGEAYERGEGIERSIDRALLHYSIAARTLAAWGKDADADYATARRGALTQIESPEKAVETAYQALSAR